MSLYQYDSMMFAASAILTSVASIATTAAPWAWGPGLAPADWDEVASRAIHTRAIVVDTHCDVTQRIVDSGADFVAGIPGAHLDLAKMRAGGLDAEFFSIFVAPRTTTPDKYFSEAMRRIAAVTDMARAQPGPGALGPHRRRRAPQRRAWGAVGACWASRVATRSATAARPTSSPT